MANDTAPNRTLGPGALPNRVLSVVDADGKELFEVEELRGREEMSRAFELSLRLRRLESAGKPPAGLLGMSLVLRWQIGSAVVRTVNGIFRDFARTSQRGRYRRYEANFVPSVWPLTQNRNCRIFQERTVPAILEEILRGQVAEFRLQRKDYDRRPQCVQYMESDFAFAQRLMEDEGIHFYFDHGRNSLLVIADASLANAAIAEPKQLRVLDTNGQTPETGGIYQLEVAEEAAVANVRVVDHCFQLENSRFEAIEPLAAANIPLGSPPSGSNVFFESYGAKADHIDVIGPEGKPRPDAAAAVGAAVKRLARLRAELMAGASKRLTATSDVWHVAPGFQFELVNASAKDDGAYLIVSIEHSYRLDENTGWVLSNQFDCLPIKTPYRPPLRTPKPTMGGLHVATVVGPANIGVWTDELGRVQLRFPWQSAMREQEQTCWVRLAQVWAGKKYGAVQSPRIGAEVLVEFLDDDPDQPVVVGSLYSESNSPPCKLPDGAAVTGIRSQTFVIPGVERRHNDFFFVDEPGKEELYLHAGRNAHFSAEQSMTHLVGWGSAPTGELDFLFGPSRSSTADFGARGEPGHVHKVKGVKRNSVWGHEIDVTVGTSSDFVIGGWAEAHVGAGVSLDIGLRTDLMVGLHVEVNIAPHIAVSVGKQVDVGTGTRYVNTAKSLTQVVGGDAIEKIAGNRMTVIDGFPVLNTVAQPSGNFHYVDVSSFKMCAVGPETGSVDANEFDAMEQLLEKSKYGAAAQFKELQSEDDMPGARGVKKSLLNKYATSLTTELGDIILASANVGAIDDDYSELGNVLFAGETIRLVADEVVYCVEEGAEFIEDNEGIELKKLIGIGGDFYRKRHQIHVRDAMELRTAAEAQIAATQASAMVKSAGAIAGVVVAGAAVAGSVVAATNADPAKWGL